MGGDEVNIFKSGKNYGFPVISYGRQNSGAMINGGETAQEGMEQPRYYWNPSIAPSGMLFYTGAKLPAWKDSLFVGAMSGMQVVRLELKGDKVIGEEKLLMDSCRRFKIVGQGPDGLIYLLTDDMPPKQNEILRLVPAKAPPAQGQVPARQAQGRSLGARRCPKAAPRAPKGPPRCSRTRPATRCARSSNWR